MSKNVQKLLKGFFNIAFIVIVVGSYVIVAQDTITGTWKANDSKWNYKDKDQDEESVEKRESKDKLHLSFSFQTAKGGNNNHGSSFAFSDLQGLSRAQVESANSTVNFRLVREAGTIEAEGTFQNGKGSGTFRFIPNQSFASGMQSRGFTFSNEKLFSATTLNLTTAFVDDLKSAGFDNLKTEDLFKAVIFKVTPQFMREMAAIGFPNLDMEDLVKARIFKIDAEYARQIADMGFKNDSLESLVKFRIFKVTPEFLREVQAEGLTNLDAEEVVKLRIFKIDGAYIRQARAENVPIEVEALVRKKIGVYSK
jgi:hypothetical protein